MITEILGFTFVPVSINWHLLLRIIDSSVKSLDHLADNQNWPFKTANKVIVNVFS